MSAPGRVTVTVSAAGVEARLSVPLDVLAAALFECGERSAGADDTLAGELTLATFMGVGGIDLVQMSEAFVLGLWADALEPSEVARWDE